jgi:hypothetical protein
LVGGWSLEFDRGCERVAGPGRGGGLKSRGE